MAKVLIPLPLQRLTEQKEEVNLNGSSVSEIIASLDEQFPGTKKLIAPEGSVQDFVNIFVNGEDIRFKQNEKTSVSDSDEVNIVLAVSGG